MLSRRHFVSAAVALAAFRNDTLDRVERLMLTTDADPEVAAQDEEFWGGIQQAFSLDRNVVNFNNGGCSPSPRVVQDVLRRQIEFSNQAPSQVMWQQLEPEVESVRRRLARTFGCDAEEIAITRNASESLENVLFGLDLPRGAEVLTTTSDYPRNITTLQQRERRDGIRMVQVVPPTVPKDPRELVDIFERGITKETKLILVSQVSFLNGQIFPVRQVCELGNRHGIPVLVDGAHAFAQFPFMRDDLACDFYGTSLHKWLMAPLGTGFLHIRKSRIPEVWSLMASSEAQKGDIRKFEEIGTHPAANHNAIGEALTFHEMIGVERKAARFRYLRHRWTDKIVDLPKVKFSTNLDPRHSCALTLVSIDDIKPGDLQAWLLAKHSIYTTTIGTDHMSGIRVTPNVYSTVDEIDRFAEAMRIAATKGIG
ncbi:aminotransferase class V-fold PLP-dependent enzyme [Fimbriimonas ginsengisoli]|uniref:Isopenicillin N epimerase n=1 Tax=Fimbriimonas ginsengisoli Gsoil 348 TaxID=661478 RepID=A0A068NX52_FIMGI|nr:aminotransferase class V-fold PLP-dependent enzyme [Fimbriimonas ginsengisoli]AIE87365.1 isopenicillin N epimerase [Fimbriimonas ginsengisoli Gsoil 348]